MNENDKLVYNGLLKISGQEAPCGIEMSGSKIVKKLIDITNLPQDIIQLSIENLANQHLITKIFSGNKIGALVISKIGL